MAHATIVSQLLALPDAAATSSIIQFLRNRPGILEAVTHYADSTSGDRASFFRGLQEESFTREEEDLRETIFEFFATWQSPDLATLHDIARHPPVQRLRAPFLEGKVPRDVLLLEWIDRRIGGEVDLQLDARTGHWIAHITDAAKPFIREKVDKMMHSTGGGKGAAAGRSAIGRPAPASVFPAVERAKEGAKGKGKDKLTRPEALGPKADAFLRTLPSELTSAEEALKQALLDCIAASGEDTMPITAVSKDEAVAECRGALLPNDVPLRVWVETRINRDIDVRKDESGRFILAPKLGKVTMKNQFFDGLPLDSLTDAEIELREALLSFLQKCDGTPRLSHAGMDERVKRARALLLPGKNHPVTLREWIDRRIGGEIETVVDPTDGQVVCGFAGAVDLSKRTAVPKKEDKGSGKGKANSPVEGLAAPERVSDITSFLQALPEDFTDAELRLRQALLDHLALNAKEGGLVLAQVAKDEEVARCKSDVLPMKIPLSAWIEHRVAAEITLWKDSGGRNMVQDANFTKQRQQEAVADRQKARDEFFESLPQDGFTPEEERLREALLDFLQTWKHEGSPSLSDAGAWPEVKEAKTTLLPKNITMRDWIDNRVGGEIETVKNPDDGSVLFGFVGTVDLQASRPGSKRKAEGRVPKGGGKKSGAKAGGGKGAFKGATGGKRGPLGEPPRKKGRGK